VKKIIRKFVERILHGVGFRLCYYYRDWPLLWSKDARFLELMDQISGRTLVPAERCFVLYQMARTLAPNDGAFAEIGVYKGGTARLLSQVAEDKQLHLFDTFEGMPDVNEHYDGHKKGDFADTSVEGVRAFVNAGDRVHFHKGYFPDSTKSVSPNLKYSLVYVDVDIYQSVKDALEYFYPKLNPGGVMIFDDFDSPKCSGVRKALDEFLLDKPEHWSVSAFYQAMLIKQ